MPKKKTSNDQGPMLADVARNVLKSMAEGIRETREAAGYSADQLKIGSLYSLTIRTVPQRIAKMGDLWAEAMKKPNTVKALAAPAAR